MLLSCLSYPYGFWFSFFDLFSSCNKWSWFMPVPQCPVPSMNWYWFPMRDWSHVFPAYCSLFLKLLILWIFFYRLPDILLQCVKNHFCWCAFCNLSLLEFLSHAKRVMNFGSPCGSGQHWVGIFFSYVCKISFPCYLDDSFVWIEL